MYLDYSKIRFDGRGLPELPVLLLETMSEEPLGVLSNVINLTGSIQFAELSEISFDLPAYSDGKATPLYDDVVGFKIIRTEEYGVYLVMQPVINGDGIEEVKHVTAYSIEKELEFKRFFLEEGTFNFWSPVSQQDTILGRVLEVAPGWSVGYVSPGLIGRYRTFDQYDENLLDFLYGSAPEKFRCVIVFDPYQKTINAYDADEERATLPIYLGFDNLVEELEVTELSDELVTAIRPYGADELDIRAVNPIGTNWIYDLSYFIANGDIPEDLAQKWENWQQAILSNRQYYQGLTALQASATAQRLAKQAQLVDLQAELQDLTNQQNVTIQALAMEITDEGREYQQGVLDNINQQIAAKKTEIADKEAEIAELDADLDPADPESYAGRIQTVNSQLAINNYFTDEEYAILCRYFVEQDFTEETFVGTTVDTSISGTSYNVSNGQVSVTGSTIAMVEVEEFQKEMYVLTGGSFSVDGTPSLSGDVIRGTLERQSGGSFVLSVYAGTLKSGDAGAHSGMVTLAGSSSGFTSDVQAVTENEITTNEGTQFSFSVGGASLYVTANVSEYQKYSVQTELYDYAAEVLADVAVPTYEFSVESGNFLFAQEFAPFRNGLQLGNGIYLTLHNGEVIEPILIGFEIDFENREELSLIFSNRFKRHDNVNTLKDMIEDGYSSGRSFDASKYIYNQTAGQASQVSDFMNGSLDAAVNTIIGASNQSVLIDGAGIHIGGDEDYQIRIVDKMIAFTDDGWSTAKMALGLFSTEETGSYFGVNAEVLGGKLIVGNSLVIENRNDQGVMQFKVDSTGAWLNNSTFVLQGDANQGRLIIDPLYGIVAGTGDLFTTEGTTVTPSFIDEDGSLILDGDGLPEDANFFLDIRDGSAYFRGVMKATEGSIGGWTIADDHLFSGGGSSYVALNASNDWNSVYAIWAGAENPNNAPFWVKKNGDLFAQDGTFKGTVSGARYEDSSGNNMMNSSNQFTSQYLDLKGITIRNSSNQITFQVTSNGDVTINGDITMGAGSTINWAEVTETNVGQSEAYQLADSANSTASSAQNTANSAFNTASVANSNANSAYTLASSANNIVSGWQYRGTTYMDGTRIMTGTVTASVLRGGSVQLLDSNGTVRGYLYIRAASSTYGGAIEIEANAVSITASSGTIYLYSGGGTVQMACTIARANSANTADLGTSSIRWNNIYLTTSPNVSSDANHKYDIEDLPEKYLGLFDDVDAKRFKLDSGTSDRYHTGFIAQDFQVAMEKHDIDSKELAAWCEGENEDGTPQYALRYEELIAIIWAKMKQQELEISAMKEVLEGLK